MANPDIEKSSKLAKTNKSKSTYFRHTYKFGLVKIYDPTISVLVENKPYLIAKSDYIKLDTIYHQRPDLLSKDTYGSTEFWYMILYINDVPSIMDFTNDFIYLPSLDVLYSYIKSYIPDRNRLIEDEVLYYTNQTKPLILK